MNFNRLALLPLALLPLIAACGKETQEPDPSRTIPGVLLMSDGEAQNAGILADDELTAAGVPMSGGWYTYDDVKDCPMEMRPGTITPTMGLTYDLTDFSEVMGMTPPPEGENNKSAFRFTGSGYALWGAGIGIAFNNPAGKPLKYDLTKTGATGIRFWARSGAGDLQLKVKIQDKYSEGENPERTCCYLDKTVCGVNECDAPGDVQGCYDAPYKNVPVTGEWTLIQIPFTELARGGFGSWKDGDHKADPVVLTEAFQLQMEVDKAYPTFDVWVDNVGLIIPEKAAAK